MGTFRQHRRLRALIATGTLAAAMALPIGVSANTPEVGISPAGSNGATIQVSNIVNITSKVLATVDVTFTCDPFLIFDFETGEFVTSTAGFGQVDVTLIQASGRSVVTATASGGSGSSPATVRPPTQCQCTSLHRRGRGRTALLWSERHSPRSMIRAAPLTERAAGRSP